MGRTGWPVMDAGARDGVPATDDGEDPLVLFRSVSGALGALGGSMAGSAGNCRGVREAGLGARMTMRAMGGVESFSPSQRALGSVA